jgi:hypothetical protein
MKIFTVFDRMNFVDHNNAFVGWENEQNCCELFRHFFASDARGENEIDVTDEFLEPFHFDKSFKAETFEPGNDCEMLRVAFRLLKSDYRKQPVERTEIYLVLENSHNGYYAHGFTFQDGYWKVLAQGSL